MSTTNNSQKDNVGTITIHENGTTGVIMGGKEDVVLAKDTNATWNVEVILSEAQAKIYNDGLAATGSNIVIEWSTGSKLNRIFSNNTAK